MWPVLIFLFVLISGTLYLWKQEHDRRNHRKARMTNPQAPFDTSPKPKEAETASNPNTNPEVLARLGTTHKHGSIRRYVASNPNTPVPTLLQLAKDFPHEVAENPILLLLQLKNPEFVLEMPYQDLVEILYAEDTPEIFINGAIEHHMSMVVTALLKNPKLSSTQLERLINRVCDNQMVHLFLSHRNCTYSTRLAIAKGNNSQFQIGLAKRCFKDRTTESIVLLEALIDHGSMSLK